jgi:hypothetical protein
VKPGRSTRSFAVAVIVVAGVLTACGASAPPAPELALEVIETLDVSESVKACMRDKVAGFDLADFEAIKRGADDNVAAEDIEALSKFQAALASCN